MITVDVVGATVAVESVGKAVEVRSPATGVRVFGGPPGPPGDPGPPGPPVILGTEPPDPTGLPEGSMWIDTDSDVPPYDGAATGHTVQDEGVPLATRAGLNFVGPAVAATDDEANDRTLVTISSPNIIVLGPSDPVPGGTPAGTIIFRTEA